MPYYREANIHIDAASKDISASAAAFNRDYW
jgi:hypothetical protein